MRIAVMGAGGVGGYYGALLVEAGHQVALIARGAHLEAIRGQGLRVESGHGDLLVRPAWATDEPAEVGPVELVLLTVKSYDLEEAARAARPLLGTKTVLLPLQNGLDAAERVSHILGQEYVLPALTHISSTVVAPGYIRQSSVLRRITLGEPGGGISQRAERVGDALTESGIEVVLSLDIQAALWSKFLFMASAGGVCAAARRPLGVVLENDELRALYWTALREVEAVARAWQVDLPRDIVERTLQLSQGFPPETRPSLLVDLEAGRRLELEALGGSVLHYAREKGLLTPVHQVLYALLQPWANGL
ncbi:MAG: 2-dehydropantoate 2-reductase [Chloroflexia bacterium]|nr:2-dehydropantoate 2-reductase [Chloroflexia bacterium]